MTNETLQVGWFTLEQEEDFSGNFESACQYRTVRVPAGRYPIEVATSTNGHWYRYVRIVLPGTVTASGYGNKVYSSEIDQPGRHVMQPYKYELRHAAESGERYWSGTVELTDLATLDSAEGV